MNNKQRKTLEQICTDPIRSDIRWNEIESLFLALGAEINESSGSRVRIHLNGVKAIFHRPHPERETNKYTIRDIREFLCKAGIEP